MVFSMKKILLIILSVGLFIASCDEKNAYTITGNLANDLYDGRYVYLYKDSARIFVLVDSALIKNKQFMFRGIAPDKPAIRHVNLENNTMFFYYVILEKGDITITTDSANVASIGGTPMNDSMQRFLNNTNDLFAEVEKETNVKKQKELLGELRHVILEYVQPNITNPIGETFFLSNSYYLKENDILELIAASSPQFKENERVQRVESLAKARMSTSEGFEIKDVKGYSQDGKEDSVRRTGKTSTRRFPVHR
jgi:hypothetical protein